MNRIALINPPIYDFSAYDFWLKPFGLLRVGGYLRNLAEIRVFDFLDREHTSVSLPDSSRSDRWGRGKFRSETAEMPDCFGSMKREFRRYGLAKESLLEFLHDEGPFDFALIQTSMTYWYPGVQEVLSVLRRFSPETKTVLGGIYATICREHALGLGADLVVRGSNLSELWTFLGLSPDLSQPAFWEGYPRLRTAVLKLSDGCPLRCTYCSVPQFYPNFAPRPLSESVNAAAQLGSQGVTDLVFYDDSLLYHPEEVLLPFLNAINDAGLSANFHTPNALNARFMTFDLAKRMVRAGFKTFYLGFESGSLGWQRETGSKVTPTELERAMDYLVHAGADPAEITCYLIVGHPKMDLQELEASMEFVGRCGIRVMLSEFSPIPGTPDGELCRKWVDLDEPLLHNKAFFVRKLMGEEGLQTIKSLSNELNSRLNDL